jgi:hypothetical protein
LAKVNKKVTLIFFFSYVTYGRGQAWVVFAEQESANKALVQLQGFPYANKEMVSFFYSQKKK